MVFDRMSAIIDITFVVGETNRMMEKGNFYHKAEQYYNVLESAVSGHGDCYELTVLNGSMAGMKVLLSGDNFYVYLNRAAVSDFEQMRDLLLHTEEIYKGPFPAIRSLGEQEIFIEKLGGSKRLVICGAGHVSIALVRISKMIGFQVTVIDDRPTFCDHARAAGADEVICEPFAKVLRAMDDADAPYFVVVTRGHQYDVDCMHEILSKRHSYIGMMGSRVRVRHLKETLLEEGYDQPLIGSVHMPIGLSIGAQTPEEIAVSIIAEIIECRHKEKEDYHYSREMLKALCSPEENIKNKALATIIVKKGCGPRHAGTKMIIMADGRLIGTIGGGCAEAAIIQKARYCMQQSICAREHVDMTGAEAAENGLVCGGVMDVFIQSFD